MYKQLFLDRWKELKNQINLDKDEDGEIISTSFLKEDIFHKFFSSPELLVGYYIWRGNGLKKDGGNAEYYFDLEYDGWADDCKDIVSKARDIFKKIAESEEKKIAKEIKLNTSIQCGGTDKLRVWWLSCIEKPFFIPVESVEEGVKILDLLTVYEAFQVQNGRVKVDYRIGGGLQVWSNETNEWIDCHIKTNEVHYRNMEDYYNQSQKDKDTSIFIKSLAEQINWKKIKEITE